MSRDNRVKRLLYQSFHRGCKETDALLGKFSRKYLSDFKRDREKDKLLVLEGWRILRFTHAEVMNDIELLTIIVKNHLTN